MRHDSHSLEDRIVEVIDPTIWLVREDRAIILHLRNSIQSATGPDVIDIGDDWRRVRSWCIVHNVPFHNALSGKSEGVASHYPWTEKWDSVVGVNR